MRHDICYLFQHKTSWPSRNSKSTLSGTPARTTVKCFLDRVEKWALPIVTQQYLPNWSTGREKSTAEHARLSSSELTLHCMVGSGKFNKLYWGMSNSYRRWKNAACSAHKVSIKWIVLYRIKKKRNTIFCFKLTTKRTCSTEYLEDGLQMTRRLCNINWRIRTSQSQKRSRCISLLPFYRRRNVKHICQH